MAARPSVRPTGNAVGSRFHLWCMGFGRNSKGFPSFCQVPAPRLTHEIVGRMLDLMPSPRLDFPRMGSPWNLLGAFANRFFRGRAQGARSDKIPAEYAAVDKPMAVKPGDVAEAFVKANAGLPRRTPSRSPATGSA